MKKKNIYLCLASILLAIFSGLSIFLIYQVFNLDILDSMYELLIAAILILIIAIIAILLFHHKKGLKIIALVLILVLGSVIGYGNIAINKAQNTLNSITDSNMVITRYELLVFDNSPNEEENKGFFDFVHKEEIPELDMTTLKDKNFAIVEAGEKSLNLDVVKKIREEIGTEVPVRAIKSVNDAYNALANKEIDVLILNESVKPAFEKDINLISKIIKVYEFEREKVDIRKEAKVTTESFVVYISGIDTSGPIAYKSRSDVNKIMVVNPLKKKILLIDIPRDYFIPLTCLDNQKDKLTHAGAHGVDCSVNSISNFFGVDINYYARVNFTSVIEIVDALGGIDIYSDYTFTTQNGIPGHHFSEGLNHVSGIEALAFSRDRYSFADGDNQRIKNQTIVLKGIINKITSSSIVSNYTSLMDVFAKNIETNMTNEEILDLVKMQLKDGGNWEVNSFAVNGYGTHAYSPDYFGMQLYMMEPNMDSVNQAVNMINELMNEYY